MEIYSKDKYNEQVLSGAVDFRFKRSHLLDRTIIFVRFDKVDNIAALMMHLLVPLSTCVSSRLAEILLRVSSGRIIVWPYS